MSFREKFIFGPIAKFGFYTKVFALEFSRKMQCIEAEMRRFLEIAIEISTEEPNKN